MDRGRKRLEDTGMTDAAKLIDLEAKALVVMMGGTAKQAARAVKRWVAFAEAHGDEDDRRRAREAAEYLDAL